MSIPVWVLLAFAGWTLLVLLGGVGMYRWVQIARGTAMTAFPGDQPHGADWYRRAMRAHANCVENLPVYAAVVVAIVVSGVRGPLLDVFALVLIAARVGQSLVHIAFPITNAAVAVRFTFFLIQVVCVVGMGILVVVGA